MGGFDLPVAVFGAGPFGVSTAAYLRSRGVELRIFGSPMSRWRAQILADVFLKSEGFASDLADPTERCTLKQFCGEESCSARVHACRANIYPIRRLAVTGVAKAARVLFFLSGGRGRPQRCEPSEHILLNDAPLRQDLVKMGSLTMTNECTIGSSCYSLSQRACAEMVADWLLRIGGGLADVTSAAAEVAK